MLESMEPQVRIGAVRAHGTPRHVLCIAGGSGISPNLSILKTVLASGGRATLLYGNRNAASTMFKEELEGLKNQHLTHFALHTVFSREHLDSPLHMGRPAAREHPYGALWCATRGRASACTPRHAAAPTSASGWSSFAATSPARRRTEERMQ